MTTDTASVEVVNDLRSELSTCRRVIQRAMFMAQSGTDRDDIATLLSCALRPQKDLPPLPTPSNHAAFLKKIIERCRLECPTLDHTNILDWLLRYFYILPRLGVEPLISTSDATLLALAPSDPTDLHRATQLHNSARSQAMQDLGQ